MESLLDQTRIPLTRGELSKLRVKALRRGVWFRVLSKTERVLMELTMRVIKRVRSPMLAKVLTSVVKKLLDAVESQVARMMREVGRPLARKLSRIARSWGSVSAIRWMEDPGFIRYLTIMRMNMP